MSCYEGKVGVQAGINDQVILSENESVTFVNGEGGDIQIVREIGPGWMYGFSRFVDEPLTEVWRELERQYNVEVEFLDTGQKYSGIFEHDDLESAVRSVCLPMGLRYTISPDGIQVFVTPLE